MNKSRVKKIIKECFLESISEITNEISHQMISTSPVSKSDKSDLRAKGREKLNEMHYFLTLNVQYYAGENLEMPKLSTKYKVYYKRSDGGFYLLGVADDADKFDNLSYVIKNRIGTLNQSTGDLQVYTDPHLSDKDKKEIEEWSSKPEVKKRREYERRNFPYK